MPQDQLDGTPAARPQVARPLGWPYAARCLVALLFLSSAALIFVALVTLTAMESSSRHGREIEREGWKEMVRVLERNKMDLRSKLVDAAELARLEKVHLEKEIETHRAAANKYARTYASLKKEYDSVLEEKTTIQARLHSLTQEHETLKQELDARSDSLLEEKRPASRLHEEKNDLFITLDTLDESIATLKNEKNNMFKKYIDMQEKRSHLAEVLHGVVEDYTRLYDISLVWVPNNICSESFLSHLGMTRMDLRLFEMCEMLEEEEPLQLKRLRQHGLKAGSSFQSAFSRSDKRKDGGLVEHKGGGVKTVAGGVVLCTVLWDLSAFLGNPLAVPGLSDNLVCGGVYAAGAGIRRLLS